MYTTNDELTLASRSGHHPAGTRAGPRRSGTSTGTRATSSGSGRGRLSPQAAVGLLRNRAGELRRHAPRGRSQRGISTSN